MTIFKAAAAAALLAGAAACALPQQSGAPASHRAAPAPSFAATQALFDAYVAEGRAAGIAGALGIAGEETRFLAAGRVGDEADAPPAGPDSLWRIYSMTEPITAMAAMALIEEGKLKLDQPIHQILPAYREMRVLTDPETGLATRPAIQPITVRHLLTHTSGLGYGFILKGPIKEQYDRLGIAPYPSSPASEAQARKLRPKSLQEFAERAATLPLVSEPGAKWNYSIGLDVLGAVIERASGMPFERYLATRLFKPLGMSSTFFTVPASEAGRLVTMDTFKDGKRVPLDAAAASLFLQPPSFPYGGAGLVSSARDYDRFLHMLQNGGELDGVRVLKPETVRLAMSDLLPPGASFGGLGRGTGGTQARAPLGFGAGGSVYLADVPGGSSKGTFGWGGAAGTLAWIDPARRLRSTIMVNYMPSDRWPLPQDVNAALFKDVPR